MSSYWVAALASAAFLRSRGPFSDPRTFVPRSLRSTLSLLDATTETVFVLSVLFRDRSGRGTDAPKCLRPSSLGDFCPFSVRGASNRRSAGRPTVMRRPSRPFSDPQGIHLRRPCVILPVTLTLCGLLLLQSFAPRGRPPSQVPTGYSDVPTLVVW